MSKTLHYRACHLCEAICGLAIETESDEGGVPRIRSIKGDPQDSFSRGHVCPKAVALQDIQDDPDRLRQPLRRVGSEWQPIGWDEAFALVASRLGEIRERHGNDAVAVYQGNPSVHNYGLTGTCSFVPARMRRCCSGYSTPCSRSTSVAPRRCRSTGWSGCARRSRSSTPSP